jgi:hypothetical protein
MATAYNTEQIGQMPGMLYQSIRLGTFTQVYPYRPGQALSAGHASLRVASDTAGRSRSASCLRLTTARGRCTST